MILNQDLQKILNRYNQIEQKLLQVLSKNEFVELSKEYSELTELVNKIKELEVLICDLKDLNEMNDPDFEQEIFLTEKNIKLIEKELQIMLIPVDKDDKKNAIVEIRSGTGGSEASLFAQRLFDMYQAFAGNCGWKVEIIQQSLSELGGIKEIILLISGKNVFSKLKFESGVHRVQRVPVTESSGRIHTSTATVAVLPEVKDIEVNINDNDLRIDVFRSSGPGGQSVNTTDSAVRITHIPTGIVVSQQDEKSQHKNRDKAMKVLKARLYAYEKDKQMAERSKDRKSQIGTGGRSERIRTYNFHESRVTDHRIGLNMYKLDQVLKGECLIEVIEPLIADYQAKALSMDDR